MVAFSFFISVFLTIVWLIFSVMHVSDNMGTTSFMAQSLPDTSMEILVVTVPIFIIWMIFSFVLQFTQARSMNSNMVSLFKQMKKSQDYTDLIARVMLEAEREVKDGFVLSRFDLLIGDLTELVAEIIYRANIASNEQIERIWRKVQSGSKWAFGKVIVEVNGGQPNFQVRLYEKSKADVVLAGTILEFCARYNALVELLEKHDRNRTFLDMIETGVYGKTFLIMSPIAQEITHTKGAALSQKTNAPAPEAAPLKPKKIYNPEASAEPKSSITSKLNIFKKKETPLATREPDRSDESRRFSAALERSFGSQGEEISEPPLLGEDFIREEPLFNDDREEVIFAEESRDEITIEPQAPVRQEPQMGIPGTTTQRTLDNLKKEWEGMKQKEDQPSYPFSGWADADNYKS